MYICSIASVNKLSSCLVIYPRDLRKLTLCVNPMATIVPYVSSMTGLDNYKLSGQSKFDNNIGDFSLSHHAHILLVSCQQHVWVWQSFLEGLNWYCSCYKVLLIGQLLLAKPDDIIIFHISHVVERLNI